MPTEEEQLTVNVPMELLEKFREAATKKFTHKRGYIKKATIEAIQDWITKESE